MTNQTIALTTPVQINAWVLLSRISQAHLHMKGYKVPGLLKWLRANVPDCANARTVKAAYCGLLDYCDQFNLSAPGGEQCNYQVLLQHPISHSLYLDQGVLSTMANVAENFGNAYAAGRVVILRTMDAVREPNNTMMEMN